MGLNARSRYAICTALEDFLGLEAEHKEDGTSVNEPADTPAEEESCQATRHSSSYYDIEVP